MSWKIVIVTEPFRDVSRWRDANRFVGSLSVDLFLGKQIVALLPGLDVFQMHIYIAVSRDIHFFLLLVAKRTRVVPINLFFSVSPEVIFPAR